VVAMVPSLNFNTIGSERIIELALPAVKEALEPINHIAGKLGEIPIFIGLPESRPGLSTGLSTDLSEKTRSLRKEAPNIGEVRTLAKGHSAGLMAMEMGSKHVLQGTETFCLVGGVDSYIDPDTLDWIEDNEQLHKPSNAWGFVPGEGAGFCLICSGITAHRLSLPVKAELVAISTAMEKNKIKTETICIGEGLTQAVRNALQFLSKGFCIDFTICDQNGEAYRADEFGFMLVRNSKFFAEPSNFMAPADCWGDVGAASGPLYVNLIASAAEKDYFKRTHALLWTSSEGGERTAAILRTGYKEVGLD